MNGIDFSTIKGILSDLDGVWFVGDDVITGAQRALARIKSFGLPMRFITNSTRTTLADLEQKVGRMGLDISRDEIINAPYATVCYLRRHGRPKIHLVVDDNVRVLFDEFPVVETSPDFVVVGDIGKRWDYDVLNRIFRMVIGGAGLVAMHKVKYWQVEDGLTLDIGAFVAGLEFATDTKAVVVGKPSATIFQSALDDAGLDPRSVVMVGDDVQNDIGGAQQLGIRGVLVRTGKYRKYLVEQSGVQPAMTVDSVEELADLITR
jgi:HAD superfamily hydrolase (TIGR01458 family)